MAAQLQFNILGPLEITRNGKPIALPAGKQRTLLIRLLLHPNEVVASERLIADIWGSDAPARAMGTLQYHVSKLRDALEPNRTKGSPGSLVVTRPPGYVLAIDEDATDVGRFHALVGAARQAPPGQASDLYREALSLRRGEPLVDVAYEDFAQAEIGRLQETALGALEGRIDADLEQGRALDLVSELEGLVAEHPLRERLWAQYMTALYRSGRQADALRAYRSASAILGEELGVEPGPELRDLEEQILFHDPHLETKVRREIGRPGNLPAHPSTFVGRLAERKIAMDLLTTTRLLSLVGPGGTGKTRIALRLAEDLAGFTAAWLIKLGALSDQDLIAKTAAAALGLTDDVADPMDRIVQALRGTRALVVVDNCEHVVEGAAQFVAELLERCPETKVIATSREPLGIAGETTYVVPPMGGPTGSGDSDAEQLFVERASAARPDVTEWPVQLVGAICLRLDGIPLAIELAAAKARTMSLEEIASKLDDKFRLLTGGDRSALPHQQTLEATFEWSYDLLTADQQTAFTRLAVFRGGWTAPAATIVVGTGDAAADETLSILVDKSLVVADTTSPGGTRYFMLETLREFGLSRLDDADGARRAHAAFCRDLAIEAEKNLRGPAEIEWMDRLDLEADNIRSAVAWGLEHDPQAVLNIAGPLKLYLMARQHLGSEAEEWLAEALDAATEADRETEAAALSTAGVLAWDDGRLDEAQRYQEAALESARELDQPERIVRALNDLGLIALDRGEADVARSRFEGSLDESRHIGEPTQDAAALSLLGQVAPPDQQRGVLEEALRLQRRVGRASGVAHVLLQLGWLALAEASLTEAAKMFRSSELEWNKLRSEVPAAVALCGLADSATLSGDLDAASAALAAALDLATGAGSTHAGGLVAYREARLALATDDLEVARTRLAEAEAAWRNSTFQPGRAVVLGEEALLAAAEGDWSRARTSSGESESVWRECRRLSGVSWAQGIRAAVEARAGEHRAAFDLCKLALAPEVHHVPATLDGWMCPEVGMAADRVATVELAGTLLEELGDVDAEAVIAAAHTYRAGRRIQPPGAAPALRARDDAIDISSAIDLILDKRLA